jgi:Protein of unknown function (DUF3048) N-terminal domain/Protein of unknown function (DUF3048) C-terminal domain
VNFVPRRVLTAVGLTLALFAAACGGGGDDEPESEPKPEKKEAPGPTAPLTGLPDPDGTAASRPAMFVKIDNADFEGARPQSGLEQADVVYEEVVEYDITRFNAVFNSQVPEPIGPIRSVRAMDSDIVWPLGGIFVFSGGTEPNVELIRQAPVNIVDENNAGDAFYRADQKDAPHNLYGHGERLLAFGGEPVPPPALFSYVGEEKSFAGDEEVGVFTVGFASGYAPTYTWDDASGTWKRDIEGEPFVMENGTQIAPNNVIVQFIEYGGGGEGTIVGEGDAWVFSDGQVTRGRWVRPAREQVAQFVDAAGKEIKLTPGSTWVEYLPIGSPVAVQPPAAPTGTTPAG